MDGFFEIMGQMITLFSIIGVGYCLKRIKYVSKEFDKNLSKVVLNVAIPGLIIGSVLESEHLPPFENILLAFAISCASFILIVAIAYVLTFILRIDKGYRGVFRFMLCFGNVGFIGFPVISSIFGQDALIYATIFNIPFNLLVFTVGVVFLRQDSKSKVKSKTSWKTFVNPPIISCVIAIVLALFGVNNVPVIGKAFATLGSFTTPGALLIIGSSLADLPIKKLIGGPRLWIASLFRLIISPICVWAVFQFFITDPLLLGAIVVISGMPVATNGTMLCYEYGGRYEVMAQGTFVTTVLSLISIPLLVEFIALVFS